MMKGFLLDTNVPSEEMRLRPDAAMRGWLLSKPTHLLFLSSITVGEIQRGILLLPAGRRRQGLQDWLDGVLIPGFADRILSVDVPVVSRWAALMASRQLMGRPMDEADGLIAATALEHNLTLATRNVKDFNDLGLTIVNPWAL